MPLARLGDTLLFFAHIPKAGGTSVEAYLRLKGRLAMHHDKTGEWMNCSPQHFHAEIHTALFPQGFCDHSFTVLRDPVARMRSEYRHRIGRAEARGREIAPVDAWVPKVLLRSLENPWILDNHLRPQAAFLSPGMRLFRLENGLDRVFDWIDSLSPDPAPEPRDHRRDLSHIEVPMLSETEALIREFYAEDCRIWESGAETFEA